MTENAETATEGAVQVETPRFSELTGRDGAKGALSMDLLADVALPVTVELGRAQLKIGDLMALGNGSVIELDRNAGDALDLHVRGVPFARGEVVVLGDRYGLRITALAGNAAAAVEEQE
jgi:flagellar motor switch protein FliN/FliY